jgi:hypothetical protein
VPGRSDVLPGLLVGIPEAIQRTLPTKDRSENAHDEEKHDEEDGEEAHTGQLSVVVLATDDTSDT